MPVGRTPQLMRNKTEALGPALASWSISTPMYLGASGQPTGGVPSRSSSSVAGPKPDLREPIMRDDVPRQAKLVQYFTTTTDWRTGARVDRLRVDSGEIVTLTRQAKSVTTAISGMLKVCKDRFDILSREEQQALNTAAQIMKHLGEDIERAKIAVKRIEAERAAADMRREQSAKAAVAAVFAQPDIETSIALLLHLGLDTFYGVGDLRRAVGRNEVRDVCYYAREVAKEVVLGLEYQVKKQIEQGVEADTAAQALYRSFAAAKPDLVMRHGDFIRQVNAMLVRDLIEKASA